MNKYTWAVLETDKKMGTMEVLFSYDGLETTLNMPLPTVETDLALWIDKFAPVSTWAARAKTFAAVKVGDSGEAEFDIMRDTVETPVENGSWAEEYLRAMVYQVLEEIRESSV